MAFKEYRDMKVYEQGGYSSVHTPTIILKGQWLREAGFEYGTPITVKCEDGRLTITPRNEVMQEEPVKEIVKPKRKRNVAGVA